jgi:hypothetical protein
MLTGLARPLVVGRPLAATARGWPPGAPPAAGGGATGTTIAEVAVGTRSLRLAITAVALRHGRVYVFREARDQPSVRGATPEAVARAWQEIRWARPAPPPDGAGSGGDEVVAGSEILQGLLTLIAEESERLAELMQVFVDTIRPT